MPDTTKNLAAPLNAKQGRHCLGAGLNLTCGTMGWSGQISNGPQSTMMPIYSLKPGLDTTALYIHGIFMSGALSIVLGWADLGSCCTISQSCFESCKNVALCLIFHRNDKVNILMLISLYNRTQLQKSHDPNRYKYVLYIAFSLWCSRVEPSCFMRQIQRDKIKVLADDEIMKTYVIN